MIKTLYKPFQKWSEKGSVYLISDTHFEDPDRDFMGYKISEEEQIYILNETLRKGDTLIHLGDVGNAHRLHSLKWYKDIHMVLVMGNHDTDQTSWHFDEVYTGPIWIAKKLVLSHPPLHLTLGITDAPIAFNIHGHDHSGEYHSGEYYDDYHLNLAQNVFGYFPLNLKNFINSGILKDIPSANRAAIDYQKKRKMYD